MTGIQTPFLGMNAGGGETSEELDISLLHVRLYHETWQGMLQVLDDVTLRANSAVPMAAGANTTINASVEAGQQSMLQQDINTQPSDQQQQLPENSTASLSEANSNSLEQPSEAKAEAMGNSMEVQLQHEARLQSEQQASSSTADMNQQHQTSVSQPGSSDSSGNTVEQATVRAVARADMSQGARMHSQQLEGSWKVFDLAAVPIDETDVETGKS